MRMIRVVVLLMIGLAYSCTSPGDEESAKSETADRVFLNGKIYTVDEDQPWAEAVAIKGDKIVYVGDAEGVKAFQGKSTVVTDLDGKMMMPGFVSGHDHIVGSRWMSSGVALNSAENLEDISRIIKEYLAANPDKERILGMGWNTGMTGGMPTAKQLDEIVDDRPVILIDYTAHEGWLNSKALELGGISKDSPDLNPGTTFWVRDADGNPTGVGVEGQWMPTFIDLGFWDPETMIPSSANELFDVAKKNGTTTVLVPGFVTPNVVSAQGSMDDYEKVMELLAKMDESGDLPLRLVTLTWFKSPDLQPEQVAEFAAKMREKYHSDMLRTGGVKVHPETNWNSWGAPMLEPYSNKDTKGKFGVTPERIKAMMIAANKRGLDVVSHADGSATIRAIIDGIEATRKAGNTAERNSIHHLIWLHPDDYNRIVKMKIPVNVTPAFSNDWLGQDKLMEEYLGKKRVETMLSRYGDLARDGVKVSISADVPSTTTVMQGPLYVVQSAITFRDPQSQESKPFPANREPMSLEQAIHAITIDAAWQLRMEDKVGSIEVGKYADLVILGEDVFEVDVEDIHKIQVLETILGGKATFRKE